MKFYLLTSSTKSFSKDGVNQTRTTTDCLPKLTEVIAPETEVTPAPSPKSMSAHVNLLQGKKYINKMHNAWNPNLNACSPTLFQVSNCIYLSWRSADHSKESLSQIGLLSAVEFS